MDLPRHRGAREIAVAAAAGLEALVCLAACALLLFSIGRPCGVGVACANAPIALVIILVANALVMTGLGLAAWKGRAWGALALFALTLLKFVVAVILTVQLSLADPDTTGLSGWHLWSWVLLGWLAVELIVFGMAAAWQRRRRRLMLGALGLLIAAGLAAVAVLAHKAQADHNQLLHHGLNFPGLQHLTGSAKPPRAFDTVVYNTTIKDMNAGGIGYSGRGGLYTSYCSDFQVFDKAGKVMDPNQLTNQTYVDVYLAYSDNSACVRWVAVAGATVPGAQAYMESALSR